MQYDLGCRKAAAIYLNTSKNMDKVFSSLPRYLCARQWINLIAIFVDIL